MNELERTMTLAIGSGNHAITYVHRTAQGRLFELPVSWYAKLRGYAMSPGYDRADHLDFRREISDACLFCHSNSRTPAAIGCERCHGDTAAHLAKPGRGNIFVSKSVETCLQCHLETSSSRFTDSLRRPGRDVFSYKPGEPLSGYKFYFAAPDDGRLEINHAGYRLLESRCFRESQGRMTCVTCHDPHTARVKRNSCQQCHAKPHTQEDCAPCHLPKRVTADAIHVSMTDHRIERSRGSPIPCARSMRRTPARWWTSSPAPMPWRSNARTCAIHRWRRFSASSP